MPPQNMPFWHEDYFELKAIGKRIFAHRQSINFIGISPPHPLLGRGGQLITGDSANLNPTSKPY